MKELIIKPDFIHLYDEPTAKALNVKEISDYLKEKLPNIEIDIREKFFIHHLSSLKEKDQKEIINSLAERIAQIRISNLNVQEISFEPLSAEIQYEKRKIEEPNHKSFGILYQGFKLQRVLAELISNEEKELKHLHIIFTNQLFGTWSESDLRYHARVVVFGFPSIISTTGLVEAPAKPREFYLKRQMGLDSFALKEEFKGRFIDYDDPRLTEVMKGYCMQALFFHMIGDPFCNDKNCRLYNAHWQEDVIHAQLESPYEFCSFHQEILNSLKGETQDVYSVRNF